jgi:hypothetical protein
MPRTRPTAPLTAASPPPPVFSHPSAADQYTHDPHAGYTSYRGVATLPAGAPLPLPLNTVRQLYGAGARAGMYPLSERELYWFTCFNADEVRFGGSTGAVAQSAELQQKQHVCAVA